MFGAETRIRKTHSTPCKKQGVAVEPHVDAKLLNFV